MEGAQAEEPSALALELHVLAHDVLDGIADEQLVNKRGGKRHGSHLLVFVSVFCRFMCLTGLASRWG